MNFKKIIFGCILYGGAVFGSEDSKTQPTINREYLNALSKAACQMDENQKDLFTAGLKYAYAFIPRSKFYKGQKRKHDLAIKRQPESKKESKWCDISRHIQNGAAVSLAKFPLTLEPNPEEHEELKKSFPAMKDKMIEQYNIAVIQFMTHETRIEKRTIQKDEMFRLLSHVVLLEQYARILPRLEELCSQR